MPRVLSFIWSITALSQDNLGGDQRLLEKTTEIHYCYCYCLHYLLVRENGWKFLTVGNVQLSQDVLRPTRHLLVTGAAFQVLRAHEVPAALVQDPPHRLIEASSRKLAPTGDGGAAEVVGPHSVWHPQEKGALKKGVGCGGWLGVEGPGTWWVPPQAELRCEDNLPVGCPPEQGPAHPVVLLLRERQPPATWEQLKHSSVRPLVY